MDEGLRFAIREGGRTVGAACCREGDRLGKAVKAQTPGLFRCGPVIAVDVRPVAQLAEQRSPKPQVGGSIPSWPASFSAHARVFELAEAN